MAQRWVAAVLPSRNQYLLADPDAGQGFWAYWANGRPGRRGRDLAFLPE